MKLHKVTFPVGYDCCVHCPWEDNYIYDLPCGPHDNPCKRAGCEEGRTQLTSTAWTFKEKFDCWDADHRASIIFGIVVTMLIAIPATPVVLAILGVI